jgi:membrane associated rhomboid family serine protease
LNNNLLFNFGVWLFYVGFIVLGVTIGLTIGLLLGIALIGIILGFLIGLGLGILTNARLVIKKYFRNQC